MNTSIITSAIIGGLLLVSIAFQGIRISQSTDQTAMDLIAKTDVDGVSQYMGYDFNKIGYKASVFPILMAKKHKFIFLGDVNSDGVCDTVMWKFGPDNTGNSNYAPGKQPVYHSINGVESEFDRQITSLEIVYILSDGTETNNPQTKEVDQIRKIKVTMTSEIPQINGNGMNEASWQKTFIPPNLQF